MWTVLCGVQCFSSSLSPCMLFVAHGSGLPGPHILLFSRSLLRRFSRFFSANGSPYIVLLIQNFSSFPATLRHISNALPVITSSRKLDKPFIEICISSRNRV